MFTETERTILNALPKEYKYIFRTRYGGLRIGKRFYGIDEHNTSQIFQRAAEKRFPDTVAEIIKENE